MSNTQRIAAQSLKFAERRSSSRITASSLTYIELGAANGGIVVNMSEGGLAIAAAGFLSGDLTLSMRIRFPGSREWIGMRGQIVWTSESRREAGVKFIDLTEDDLDRIKNWISLEASQDQVGSAADAIPEPRERSKDESNTHEPRSVGPVLAASGNTLPDQSRVPVSLLNLAHSPSSAVVSEPVATSPVPIGKTLEELELLLSNEATVHRTQREGQLRIWLTSISLVSLVAIISFILGMAAGRGPGSGILGSIGSNKQITDGQKDPKAPTSPSLMAGAPSRPVRNPPSQGPQITNSTAANAAVQVARDMRPQSPAIEPALRKQSISVPPTPLSERVNELPAPGTAAEKTLLPAVKPPENFVNATGSIDIISDPYASFHVPPKWKERASQPGISLQIGRLISKVEPLYPQDALRQGIAGTVMLHVVVDRSGAVERAEVADGPSLLAESAVRAVQQWRYEPTLLGGEAIEAEEDVTMVFQLTNPLTPTN
jgi:TonB family protein